MNRSAAMIDAPMASAGIATRHRFGSTVCEVRTEPCGSTTRVSIYIVQEGSLALQPFKDGDALGAGTHEQARALAVEMLEARFGAQTTVPATVESCADYRVLPESS